MLGRSLCTIYNNGQQKKTEQQKSEAKADGWIISGRYDRNFKTVCLGEELKYLNGNVYVMRNTADTS